MRNRSSRPSATGPSRRRWVPAVVVAGLVALAVAGCDGSRAQQEPGARTDEGPRTEELTVGGQPAVAIVPATPNPRGLVIYLHGYGGDHLSLQRGDDEGRVAQRLVADGYVVAASDAHGDAWGNAASQQDYVDLAAELTRRYATPRTFLWAESMGTLAALHLLAGDRIPGLAGLAAVCPLTDLGFVVDGQFQLLVRQAYGGRLPTGTQDPAQLPAEDFRGDHIRFYVASHDQTVPTELNAGPFTARVGSVADVSTVPCQGGHIDPSCFQPDDLTDWFNRLAG